LGKLITDGQKNSDIAKQGDYGILKQNTVNATMEFTEKPKILADIGNHCKAINGL
jgi:hypothetical protein